MRASLIVVLLALALFVLLPVPFAHAAAPPNDDLADATVILNLPFTDTVDTTHATTEPGEPSCASSGRTVWYVFTPESDMHVFADTFWSSYDTTLAVYTDPPGPDTEIACNDDAAQSPQSAVAFDAVAGETYYFMVGSYHNYEYGDLIFNVGAAPPPLDLSIAVDSKGTFNPKTGEASVSGAVFCASRAIATVYGYLEQKRGHAMVYGWFYEQFQCEGETPWSAVVEPVEGLFKGGKTLLWAATAGCDFYDCYSDQTEPMTIILTGGK